MSRIAAIGLTAFILTACGPADQTAPPEPATPATSAATEESATANEPTESTETSAIPESAPPAPTLASWEAMQDHYRQIADQPTAPLEALEHRAVLCDHYRGEVGGNGSERDQWLNAQMDRYRCEELLTEVRAMRDASSGQPAVVARLDTVLSAFE